MKSKWFELKEAALDLRKNGCSIRDIESKLHIPKSTLSGWFCNLSLSPESQKILKQKQKNALSNAREKATLWHHHQKQQRIESAKEFANAVLQEIDSLSHPILSLALAMLYMGEGFKKSGTTGLGSSDPLILKFFLKSLKLLYGIEDNQFKVSLFLRADQDPNTMMSFWASELRLPLSCFRSIHNDRRTKGTSTYKDYKGVCTVTCGRLDIERQLVFISNMFCQHITDMNNQKS